jgi:hypothetical protein
MRQALAKRAGRHVRPGNEIATALVSNQTGGCRMTSCKHVVELRNEVDGRDRRFLGASITESGDLLIEGQDLGPSTWPVSGDGEYEWWRTIKAEHFANLLRLLDAPADASLLQVLATHWTGAASYELEKRIREGGIPSELSTWSG